MPPLLFDTSIYITVLKTTGDAVLEMRRLAGGAPVWLSAVVLAELCAGASPRDKRLVDNLEATFVRTGRVLIPNARDWGQAGRMLALLRAKHGYEDIGRKKMLNDALIATSAARTGTTVVTFNARDFARLSDLRPFQWRLGTAG